MISIGSSLPDDVELIASLLEELDRFYGATSSDPVHTKVAQIRDALFGNPPAAYALVARDDSVAVGLAAYSFLWPAVGLTRSLYLKELYVAKAHRARGIGKLLMGGIFGVAAEQGCSRVEWATDKDNLDAQRFYDRLGFRVESAKVVYRVEGQDVTRAFELLNVGRVAERR